MRFEKHFRFPPAGLSFFLPPGHGFGSMTDIGRSQTLSPGTPSESANVRKTPNLGPTAIIEKLAARLRRVTDKLKTRPGHNQLTSVLDEHVAEFLRSPAKFGRICRKVHSPGQSADFQGSNIELSRKS